MHGFWAQRLALSAEAVQRAIQRGELGANAGAELIIETIVGPLWLAALHKTVDHPARGQFAVN